MNILCPDPVPPSGDKSLGGVCVCERERLKFLLSQNPTQWVCMLKVCYSCMYIRVGVYALELVVAKAMGSQFHAKTDKNELHMYMYM